MGGLAGEFGFSLQGLVERRGVVVLALGTAAHRTERDELQFVLVRTAFLTFAETVRRLKEAGAVILGKLGTHEFANGAMTPDQQKRADGVFAQDVAGNLEAKFAQIVLNNSAVYQPDRIAWAHQRLQADATPALEPA